MKKAIFTLAIVLLALTAQAQFKVHDDGQVSLGSLTQNFGVQVRPNGYTYFQTQYNTIGSWATMAKTKSPGQKHWIIENLYNTADTCWKKHMFYVYGNGKVHYTSLYAIGNSCLYSNSKASIDGEEALTTILNINGYYFDEDPLATPEEITSSEYIEREAVEGMIRDLEKHKVEFSAENLSEVFPDAVRTDPEARLCIDYNAVVTMLVEAVKQQQNEIELLRKALEDNGLLEPEKP